MAGRAVCPIDTNVDIEMWPQPACKSTRCIALACEYEQMKTLVVHSVALSRSAVLHTAVLF